MSYRFPSLIINNREVQVDDIITLTAQPNSDFELTTFTFIRDWLRNTEQFTIQTSGSTGNPKHVLLSRNQMIESARRTLQAIGIREGDTSLICLNTRLIAGKMMLVRSLEFHLKMVVIDPASDPFQHLDEEIQPDFAAFVPLQLQTLLNNPRYHHKLNCMKAILVGGAPFSPALAIDARKLMCRIFATYGMTETASNVALLPLNGIHASDYYEALPGITLHKDERGCLAVKVPEIPEPLVTNDFIEIKDESHFKWMGRWDLVINSGGIKISPEKIEGELALILNELRINRSYFVGSTPDEKLGERITLFIEGPALAKQQEEMLLVKLRSKISTYEVPRSIQYLARFIFTASDKIDRAQTLSGLI